MTFLLSGMVFGLSAGLSPGPLLTLVVSETLKYGTKEGLKVAVAPLLTDVPIVSFTVIILSRLSDIEPLIGSIFLLGAAFLVYLGYESLSFKGIEIEAEPVRPHSLRRGVVANFLNPHPYLFWLSIGAPTVLKASKIDVTFAVVFLSVFYIFLVGSKLFVAALIGRTRHFLRTRGYRYAINALGIVLFVFAVIFLADGLRTLGVF